MTDSERGSISRRRFVAVAGTAAGSLLLDPTPVLAALPGRRPRFGLILPARTAAARQADDILAGFRLGAGEGVEVLVRRGAGTPSAVVGEARRMLAEGGVTGIAGLIAGADAAVLRPELESSGVPFVALDACANWRSAPAVGPIVESGLCYWQANWALGAHAGRLGMRRVVVCASFYESGFDALYAFGRGLESEGGEVVETVVTHVEPADDGLSAAFAAVRSLTPDAVFALYSGAEASAFARGLLRAGTARVPLLGGPMTADAMAAVRKPLMLASACWDPGSRSGRLFAQRFAKVTRRRAGSLAALGFDAGRAAVAALGLAPDAEPLAGRAVYLRRTGPAGSFRRLAEVSELEPAGETIRDEPRTGWINPYASMT